MQRHPDRESSSEYPVARRMLSASLAASLLLLGGCEQQESTLDVGLIRAAAKIATPASGTTETAPTSSTAPTSPLSNEICTCTKTYRTGRVENTASCDDYRSECADVEQLIDCGDSASGACDYLRRCECDCRDRLSTQSFEHDAEDGVYLTGIPDLWQFAHGCGVANPNAVGCGPVALATVFYWWAQKGYAGLVEDHVTAAGLQDWQGLVTELRDDYADGGLCFSPLFTGQDGAYATTQTKMTEALDAFPEDHGYSAAAGHYRVCDGCNTSSAGDLAKGEGLDKVIEQLEAGKPVVMGYNAARAQESFTFADGESIFTGDLSVGTGWISHYAVITGYRRTSTGRDVIYVNVGSDQYTDGTAVLPDLAYEWLPGNKWVHLFTLSLSEPADGTPFCGLDHPSTGDTFSTATFVELSHSTKTQTSSERQFTATAGSHCGIARDGATEVLPPQGWNELNLCPLASHLPDSADPGVIVESLEALEEELPLP